MPGRLPARPECEMKPLSTLRSGATARLPKSYGGQAEDGPPAGGTPARSPVEGQRSPPITRSAAGRAAGPLWISPGGYGL